VTRALVGASVLAAMVSFAQALAGETDNARVEELRSWSVKIDDAQKRFEVLKAFHGQAVLDRETQLVWQQSPATDFKAFFIASGFCNTLNVDNRLGWRLPTVQELATLVDASVKSGVPLPSGSPFANVQSSAYWTSTTGAFSPNLLFVVSFLPGAPVVSVTSLSGGGFLPVWCVRGGLGSGVPSAQ
jgi:hypothetical protein